MNKKRKEGLIMMLIAVGVLMLLVLFTSSDDTETEALDIETATSTVSTTTLEDLGITIGGLEGGIIELVEITAPEVTFDLHRPIVFKGVFAENVEAQLIMTKKINDLVAEIETDGGTLTSWIDLGILWKQVDDYDGAVLAWNYASEISPLNHISYTNLGNLYHLYLNDYVKAEENFLIAINNKQDNIPAYIELHSLYANSYTENHR